METLLHTSFVKSSAVFTECPPAEFPEYAFVGRSNVGKSSLINMLTGRKSLAKISGKPGKTQLINHFSISYTAKQVKPNWYLVDLPGYGYAKVSKKERNKFKGLIYNYLKKRDNLFCTFVLIDIRHEAQPNDLEFMEWLGTNGLPFAMAFTKTDKLKPGAIDPHVEAYGKKMLETWEALPPQFITSAESGLGREEVLEFIRETNKMD
jgi:GTP-binding protein